MHIAPYDNANKPIVDVEDQLVPLNYFNIVKLRRGEHHSYQLSDYESCVVPATGRVSVKVENKRIADFWYFGMHFLDLLQMSMRS